MAKNGKNKASGNGGVFGVHKFTTELEREEALVEIARMDRRGYSQTRIAAAIGISQSQVCQYLKKIKQMYREEIIEERTALVNEKWVQYKELMEAAWDGYEASKVDLERVSEEESQFGQVTGYKTVRTKETRLASVAYLKVIENCLNAQKDLRGLDAPKETKSDNRMIVQSINWDALVGKENELNHVEERLRLEANKMGATPNGSKIEVLDQNGKVIKES